MSNLKKLLEQIEISNRRHGLFRKNDRLVLGVSGGSDSIALLMLLEKLKKKYSFTLHIAHLNHGFLKSESKKYQYLVHKLSKKLGFSFHCKSIELRKCAKIHKRSLEETGRIERYRFFEEVARKTGANKIITAHTLDDQAETMLLRLLRGSGLKGLAGIPYKRPQGKFAVIRPLLSCEKKDLVAFLKENKIAFVCDKTNREWLFTRNRVRHQLLPMLKKFYNPQIARSLASLQSICSEAQDYMERVSWRAFKHCVTRRSSAHNVALRIKPLQRLHPAILSEVLLKALETVKGNLKKFTYDHIAAIMEILNSKEKNLECHFPDRLVAKKKGENLVFYFQGND